MLCCACQRYLQAIFTKYVTPGGVTVLATASYHNADENANLNLE